MTTWYVKAESSNGDGSEAAPFGTLEQADRVVAPGDVVEIGDGVYSEKVQPKAQTTWRAATGATPIFDGGWNGKRLTSGGNENLFLVKEPNVKLKGLTIRNVKGNGIAVAAGGDFFLAEDCYIHDTYGGAVGVNGTGTRISRPTFRRCATYRTSRSWETVKTSVQGNFIFRYVDEGLVEDCIFAGGFGEALAAGVQTGRKLADGTEVMGLTVRGCIFHSFMHLLTYGSNRARNVWIENCIYYQTGDPEFQQADGHVGAGIVIGDEKSGDKDKGRQSGENVTIVGCVFVNVTGLGVRNNLKNNNTDGYHTPIQNLRMYNCTIVGGPNARFGISTAENPLKPPTVKGLIEKNLFIFDTMPEDEAWNVNTPDVIFRNNAFTTRIPAKAQGNGNFMVSLAAVVNPLVPITGTAAGSDFNLDNYRPTKDGPLATLDVGALKPLIISPPDPPEEPPPPPPPPPVDPDPEPPDGPEPPLPAPTWREQLSERERGLVGNCEQYAAGNPAGLPGHNLMLLIAKLANVLDEKEGGVQ
jgi:hypothetical protein